MRDAQINGLPEFLTAELKAVGNEAEQEARKNGCASVEVLKNVYAEAIMLRVARDAGEIIEGLRVELGRLSAPVVGEPVLDAPAQVGSTRFGKGIKWSTVIGCAQRYAEYMAEPEQEAARLARFAETLARVHGPSA